MQRTSTQTATRTDEQYQEWMRQVAAAVSTLTGGLSYQDLPDYAYMDAFEDGRRPIAVARAAIRRARSGE